MILLVSRSSIPLVLAAVALGMVEVHDSAAPETHLLLKTETSYLHGPAYPAQQIRYTAQHIRFPKKEEDIGQLDGNDSALLYDDDDPIPIPFRHLLVTHPMGMSDEEQSNIANATTVWSNDFHISTIGDVKALLSGTHKVKFIDKSLSGHCKYTNTCATDLKVLDRSNGMHPDASTRKKFFEAYRNDTEMRKVDICMCFHPSAMCELFMPLKKRLFVVATTRYELGRESPEEWKQWNSNLKNIASDPKNFIAANNLYDAKYIEYFTGLNVEVMTSWVPMPTKYSGISTDILVATHARRIYEELGKVSPRLKDLRQKYENYEYAQLAENTAIVHIPYQVSVMSLFEQYQMGIPILVPTPQFLWTLHNKYNVVSQRTWQQVRQNIRPRGSPISASPKFMGCPDPNNDKDRDAFLYWVKFGDFWQFPHIIQFDSWSDLKTIIDNPDKTYWKDVSKNMLLWGSKELEETKKRWLQYMNQPDQVVISPMSNTSIGTNASIGTNTSIGTNLRRI